MINNKIFIKGLFQGLLIGLLFFLFIFILIQLYKKIDDQTFWSFIIALITIIGWVISYFFNNSLHKKSLKRDTKIELYKKLSFDLYAKYKEDVDNFYGAMYSFDFIDKIANPAGGRRVNERWDKFVDGVLEYFYKLQSSYFTMRNVIRAWDTLFLEIQSDVDSVDIKWKKLSDDFEHFKRNISWISEEDYYKFHNSTMKVSKETTESCNDFMLFFDDLLKKIHNELSDDLFS